MAKTKRTTPEAKARYAKQVAAAARMNAAIAETKKDYWAERAHITKAAPIPTPKAVAKPKPPKAETRRASGRVCAFRLNKAEARLVDSLVAELNERAKAAGIARFVPSEIYRAALLDWASRTAARDAQAKIVAKHVGEPLS